MSIAVEAEGSYYFAVTAYDVLGNESVYSEEVVYSFGDGPVSGFALGRNFPNPFNPVTLIPFHLQQPSQVHLAVYNMRGREVKVLLNGMQPAGDFTIRWDGKDNAGHPVASGIYFCRLKALGKVTCNKMILLR